MLKLLKIKRLLLFFILFFIITGCAKTLKEKDITEIDKSYPSLKGYSSTFYLSSPFGAVDFDVNTDLVKSIIVITIKDTLQDSPQGYLKYNKRWFFKDVVANSEYYPIKDESFLEYLKLNTILPNSSFIIDFFLGTYPYKAKVPNNSATTIHITDKEYYEDIDVLNKIPVKRTLYTPEKKLIGVLLYSQKGITAPSFFIPAFLTIQYKNSNINLALALTKFKKNP